MGPKFARAFYWGTLLIELLKGVLFAAVILVLLHFFVATIFVVEGASMEPNLHTGEYLIVEKLSYLNKSPQRGDIVVVRFPGDPDRQKYIKRVIGAPGDHLEIKDNKVFVNDVPLEEFYLAPGTITEPPMETTIPKDEFFLVGDNRENSNDSRIWGTASRKFIVGRAWLLLWPSQEFGLVTHGTIK